MHYRLADRHAARGVREAIAWLRRNLAETPQIVQDRKKLQKIVRTDREALCKKQNRS